MRILFVGAGAIGSLFGGILATTESVWLVGRERHINAIKHDGLLVFSRGKELLSHPMVSEEVPEKLDFDCVIVTTKVFDLKMALLSIRRAGLADIPIIILQNGYGNEEIAREILPESSILRAITTEGAHIPTPGQVVRAGIGRTLVGFSKSLKLQQTLSTEFCKKLSSVGLTATATAEIAAWTWGKVLVNATINPICALVNCKNGLILENPHLNGLMRRLVSELTQLSKCIGAKLPFEDLREEVERVLLETKENRCSMLQDIMAKRQTEIKFLNGQLSKLAQRQKIPTAINNSLLGFILGKEKIGFRDADF